ncbi:MAG: hypothetical protein H6822_00705 [Planctomycetaceae bacterium]|nr:hypothetical protein [Planctomycetales bacterium]MCB9920664.1 hypothetical protein [Planctomycetaceae bacterium]
MCLIDGPEHAALVLFFWDSHPFQREASDLHDGHDQSQQGDEPGVSAPKLNDFPLELMHISVMDIDGNDLCVGSS